jgi:hypothetical protein
MRSWIPTSRAFRDYQFTYPSINTSLLLIVFVGCCSLASLTPRIVPAILYIDL